MLTTAAVSPGSRSHEIGIFEDWLPSQADMTHKCDGGDVARKRMAVAVDAPEGEHGSCVQQCALAHIMFNLAALRIENTECLQ